MKSDNDHILITPEMIGAGVTELAGWENDNDTKEDAVRRIIQKALSLCPAGYCSSTKCLEDC